jgi:type IV secretion system protein VirB2
MGVFRKAPLQDASLIEPPIFFDFPLAFAIWTGIVILCDDNKVITVKQGDLMEDSSMRAISLVSRLPALAGSLTLFAYVNIANASTTGSGGDPLPWETPLARILASFTGPVAKTLCILSIVLVGFGFAFSEGGGLRRILGILLGVSIAVTATSFGVSFFGFDGGAGF